MPSGRTHDSITLWSLPLIAGLTFARTQSSSLTLCVAGGYLFSGLMFGPDLDVHSQQYKRWGWLRWIWLPYRRSMRHRSFWSHGPIAGTVVRVAYLLIWVGIFGIGGGMAIAIACQLTGITSHWSLLAQQWFSSSLLLLEQASQQYPMEAIAIALGLELGALSHSCSDWILSTYRRSLNRRSKKAAASSQPSQQPSLPPDLSPAPLDNDTVKPPFLQRSVPTSPPQTRREPQLPPFRRRRDEE